MDPKIEGNRWRKWTVQYRGGVNPGHIFFYLEYQATVNGSALREKRAGNAKRVRCLFRKHTCSFTAVWSGWSMARLGYFVTVWVPY